MFLVAFPDAAAIVFSSIAIRCHLPHQKERTKKNQLLLENWKTQIKKSTFDWYFISSIFVANIHAHTYTHTLWRRRRRRRLYLCNTQGWKSIIFMLVYAFSIFQQWQYSTLFLSSTGILSEAIQYKQAGRQANFIGDFFLFNICRLYFNFVLVYIMNYNVCARVSECIECFHHHRNHRRRHRFFVSNWWEKLSKMILDQWTFQTSKHTHSHTHPVRMYINRWDGILCTINRQVCRTGRINEKLCQFSRVVFLHTHCIQSLYGIQLPKINTVWKLYTASSNYNVNTQFMFYTYVCAIEQRALKFGAILYSVLSNIKCVHFATYTHDAMCPAYVMCILDKN